MLAEVPENSDAVVHHASALGPGYREPGVPTAAPPLGSSFLVATPWSLPSPKSEPTEQLQHTVAAAELPSSVAGQCATDPLGF